MALCEKLHTAQQWHEGIHGVGQNRSRGQHYGDAAELHDLPAREPRRPFPFAFYLPSLSRFSAKLRLQTLSEELREPRYYKYCFLL